MSMMMMVVVLTVALHRFYVRFYVDQKNLSPVTDLSPQWP